MGHSEMLLAVAGLKPDEVTKHTEKLADGDWSEFPAAERLAFRFAYDVTKQPWAINDADVEQLVATFGRERAIDIIWYSSWCNYMTRVADAFQLQLESTNVFARPPQKEKKDAKPKKDVNPQPQPPQPPKPEVPPGKTN